MSDFVCGYDCCGCAIVRGAVTQCVCVCVSCVSDCACVGLCFLCELSVILGLWLCLSVCGSLCVWVSLVCVCVCDVFPVCM